MIPTGSWFPRLISLFAVIILAGCAAQVDHKKANFHTTSFDKLPGWETADLTNSFTAFQKSCEALLKKQDTLNIHYACRAARTFTPDRSRAFFEAFFEPYHVNHGQEGLFTGYFEPVYDGAVEFSSEYRYPVYGVPLDLVTIDLGSFGVEAEESKLVGRVNEAATVVPYFTRADINRGAIEENAPVLAWLKDPVDRFFLHIQGSGKVALEDGTTRQIGYAGVNGHRYESIGKVLLERNELRKEDITMTTIRQWLYENPGKALTLQELNPRYVFFRELQTQSPVGSLGVPLTEKVSLAVDPAFIPLGVPVWLDIENIDTETSLLQTLAVAQDTGAAIKGPVRGDLYWGSGFAAGEKAGSMKSRGRYYVLLPKAIKTAIKTIRAD